MGWSLRQQNCHLIQLILMSFFSFWKHQKTCVHGELDPVGSTVRYEMMKLCTGSVQDTKRRQQLVIDDTGSVEDIHAFIYAKSGDLDRCYRCLTDSQSKDRAAQLLTKYKSGALVTQCVSGYHYFSQLSSSSSPFLCTSLSGLVAEVNTKPLNYRLKISA